MCDGGRGLHRGTRVTARVTSGTGGRVHSWVGERSGAARGDGGGADISAGTGGRAPVPASLPVTPPHGDRESSRGAALPGRVPCRN